MRYIFARHGESTANAAGLLMGRGDAPLSSAGRAQALRLRDLLGDTLVDEVLCSPSARATQTAALAQPRAPLFLLPSLRERDLGPLEGRRRREVLGSPRGELLLRWGYAGEGVEPQSALAMRALSGLSHREEPRTRLIVAHAGVLRVILGLLDDVPLEEIGALRVPHATPIERLVPRTRWRALLHAIRPDS